MSNQSKLSKQEHSGGRVEPRPSRPQMPQSYGISSVRDAHLLTWRWVEGRMSSARNYWVITARPDARPHAMPVWGIWLEGRFYFSTGHNSRKARNLAANKGLVVHLESGDEVVILEGVAEKATDPLLLTQYADAYEAKYEFRPHISDSQQVTYTLRHHVAFGWLESDFPNTATRWQFDDG